MISLSVVYNRSCDLLVRGLQKHSIPFLPFLLFVFPFPFSFLLSHQPRTLSQSTYFSKPSPSDVGTDYYHSPSDTCHFVSSESYRALISMILIIHPHNTTPQLPHES
ncbi:hypothetical protein PTKIN_Ptkin08bG0083000 [Pterospermum kingtungense]